MKNFLMPIVLLISFSIAAQEQQAKPQLLKEPADWSFERFVLPPVFAPDFPYNGAEELRFSPGMFHKDSATYFSYAFVAELNNTTTFSKDNVKDYLLKYFTGLCSSTARERKLVIDSTKITVAVEPKKDIPAKETIYNALLNVFGVFQDGAPVKLNMEIKVLLNPLTKNAYLIFIASSSDKTNAIWQQLYKIREDFKMPK